MNCSRQLKKLLKTLGRPVQIINGQVTENTLAVIQLMRYKNKMYVDLPISQVGVRDTGCYLYIGFPEIDFTDNWRGIIIKAGGAIYGVKRAHMIYCGKKPFYLWAVLYRRTKGGSYEGY